MNSFKEAVEHLASRYTFDLTADRQWLQATRDDPRHLELYLSHGELIVAFYFSSTEGTFLCSPSAVLDIVPDEWRVIEVSRVTGELPQPCCCAAEIERLNRMALENADDMGKFFDLWAYVLLRCWSEVPEDRVAVAEEPPDLFDFPESDPSDLSVF